MGKYTSKFEELGFYVNGELKRFTNGIYIATDKDEIAVLDSLTDAARNDEAKAEVKPEASPRPKATTRKASAK